MTSSVFYMYAAAILAAILDSEKAKRVAGGHPPEISFMGWYLAENAIKWLLPNIARFTALAARLYIYISIVQLKFGVDIQRQLKLESGNKKIQYGHPVAILKLTLLKINRLLLSLKLKFQSKLDLHSGNHATFRVQKPKNPIWPPGGHFENDVAENQ